MIKGQTDKATPKEQKLAFIVWILAFKLKDRDEPVKKKS